jgi:hypothetical protein
VLKHVIIVGGVMNIKDQNVILKKIVRDIIWMAIRYAHGRHTYAPSAVREAMERYKKICPDYKYHDITINPPDESELKGFVFRSDFLDDLLD